MKEDILEQLVDEYLQHKGYFTIHNTKFRPATDHSEYTHRQDSVHSDIDVIGYNPTLSGADRVVVVSCKSWQGGFHPDSKLTEFEENKISAGRESWRGFRELLKEKWTQAFFKKIEEITGATSFTYVTAVTVLRSPKTKWESYEPFKVAMRGNPVKILTLNEMLDELYPSIDKTPASSSVGRFLQLVKASRWIESRHH